MKTRVITAAVGLAILVVIIFLFDTAVLNVMTAAISVLAVYELLLATKYINNKALAAADLLIALIIPFSGTSYVRKYVPLLVMAFVLFLFILLLIKHKTMRIEHISFSFLISTMVPTSLTTLIFLRDRFPGNIGLLYFLLALGAAWLADAGAYFIGIAIGKHKLAPEISPKKTVEGAVGGIIICIGFSVFVCAVYSSVMELLGTPVIVNYIYVAVMALVASLLGMLGDLSASIIKRQCSIKDFGNVMPGHGGILDRFDSVLFSAPFIYVVALHVPAIVSA